MLSRVSDSLYWMSRYVERVENIARIVDVNLQLQLDVPSRQARALARHWLPIVACLGDEESFRARYKKTDVDSVVEFLVFDREHPNSIAGSLSAARENARTVREQITSEMWEQINRTYLWITSKAARQSFDRNHYEFFQRVQKTLQLFQGITDSVMVRDEGWEFIQIGKYLERADKTTRLLDEDFHLLRPDGASPNDLLLQWLAILRCCNARQTYQRRYEAVVQPARVAELLLFDDHFPRSVKFCVLRVDQALRRMSGVPSGRFSNRGEKLSGRLFAELCFGSIEEIQAIGLHAAMDDLQRKLNDLGSAVLDSCIHLELPPEQPAALPAVPVQQQQ
jgi:uncharacterized alpha-E superfamily protein